MRLARRFKSTYRLRCLPHLIIVGSTNKYPAPNSGGKWWHETEEIASCQARKGGHPIQEAASGGCSGSEGFLVAPQIDSCSSRCLAFTRTTSQTDQAGREAKTSAPIDQGRCTSVKGIRCRRKQGLRRRAKSGGNLPENALPQAARGAETNRGETKGRGTNACFREGGHCPQAGGEASLGPQTKSQSTQGRGAKDRETQTDDRGENGAGILLAAFPPRSRRCHASANTACSTNAWDSEGGSGFHVTGRAAGFET